MLLPSNPFYGDNITDDEREGQREESVEWSKSLSSSLARPVEPG